MLTHLQLRDLVIVDRVELDFTAGVTALTGETGAGKSIVVDALTLIAGGRAPGDIVRQGAERAEVAASFTGLPDAARVWLEAQSIEYDGEVVVRRVISADGRSRAYVNGQLVPLQQLREFSDFLIEIHGQQEFQHLVKRGAQRAMLDEHVHDPGLKAEVATISVAARACRNDYEALAQAAENRESRVDLLRYQLVELQAEVSTLPAIEELFLEQKRISGRGRLSAAAQSALTAIYEADDGSAHDLLAKAQSALRGAADLDPALDESSKLLAEATILTHEAAAALRRYLDVLDVDPARQEEIERRAAALEALARKHRVTVLELPAQRLRLEQELQSLETAEISLAELKHRLALLTRDYRAAADRLTQARRHAAETLGSEVTALMQRLGMSGGRFAVQIEATDVDLSPQGADEVEFLVSANPGQPLKSLAKVASGGELSRISLAVQVTGASHASSLCMVFDEVDSGIGGGTAEIVGRQLRDLGERSQVLCVTHLGQVAAQAHSQLRVIKQSDGQATRTSVRPLTDAERIDEIARMLGGIDITDRARAHAQEMLDRGVSAAPEAAASTPVAANSKKKRSPAHH